MNCKFELQVMEIKTMRCKICESTHKVFSYHIDENSAAVNNFQAASASLRIIHSSSYVTFKCIQQNTHQNF